MSVRSRPTMTYAEYAEAEAEAEVRSEYIRGEVVAMAGGSPEHGAVAMAAAQQIGTGLSGRPCRVYSSDVRVRIEVTDAALHPDLSVVCERLETADDDPHAITNPVLIVEVLSPSTEAYDRGPKANHYRHLASVREIVLISPAERRVEVQRHSARGVWELHSVEVGVARLESVGVDLDLEALFADPLA